MVRPSRQDLYLMQNEHGLIKIGRSVQVADRLANLCQSERCSIRLVEKFRRSGHYEEDLHLDLNQHRLIGEWFAGTDEARAAIGGLLGISDIEWPFAYDAAAADQWVANMRKVRAARRLKKAIGREITILKRVNEPGAILDPSIFILLQDPLIDAVNPVEVHIRRGRPTMLHRDRASGKLARIPAYTTNVDAALMIWPESNRPKQWQGTALDCCIAGLSALKSSIREFEHSA